MFIEPTVALPFDLAHTARSLQVPAKLSWQQLLRSRNCGVFLRLGSTGAVIYSLYLNAVVAVLVMAARSSVVPSWMPFVACVFLSPWSPFVIVVDMAISLVRGFRSPPNSRWMLDRRGLTHDPVVRWGSIDWSAVTSVGRRGDIVVVVDNRKLGFGLAAQPGVTTDEIVGIVEANTGFKVKRPNALAYLLAFGPWS